MAWAQRPRSCSDRSSSIHRLDPYMPRLEIAPPVRHGRFDYLIAQGDHDVAGADRAVLVRHLKGRRTQRRGEIMPPGPLPGHSSVTRPPCLVETNACTTSSIRQKRRPASSWASGHSENASTGGILQGIRDGQVRPLTIYRGTHILAMSSVILRGTGAKLR
jgi:hypothetical protein